MNVRALMLSLLLAAIVSPAYAADASSDDPLTASAGKWDVKCAERGCVMVREVLIGNPTKPVDDDYMTVTAAFERATKKPAFLSFEFAPDSEAASGLQFVFVKTVPDGASFRPEVDLSTQRTLPVTCDKNACTARIENGMLGETKEGGPLDVVDAFLHYNLFLFRFQREGKSYQGSTPLFAFVRDHKVMMAELQK